MRGMCVRYSSSTFSYSVQCRIRRRRFLAIAQTCASLLIVGLHPSRILVILCASSVRRTVAPRHSPTWRGGSLFTLRGAVASQPRCQLARPRSTRRSVLARARGGTFVSMDLRRTVRCMPLPLSYQPPGLGSLVYEWHGLCVLPRRWPCPPPLVCWYILISAQ